jgi:hypothetical protein
VLRIWAKLVFRLNGVMLRKGRIMQGMEFLETAKVDEDLGAMGIRTSLPVLDRTASSAMALHSISIGICLHRGEETCARESFENVHIIQGSA